MSLANPITGLMHTQISRSLLDGKHVFHPWELPNFTQRTLKAVFPSIPTTGAVRHRHILLVGRMESGKSVLINWLAAQCQKRYGAHNCEPGRFL